MNCPTCNTPLLISDRQGIEIDYCPKCRGIWLDRGELDKIAEKSATVETKWHQFFNDESDDKYKPEHRKYEKRLSWRFVRYWITKSNALWRIN